MAEKDLVTTFCIFILTITCTSVAGAKCKDGTDISQYTGQVSITDGGRPCQKWAKKKPHTHNFTKDDNFPLDGTAEDAENFCRNVDNDPVPWCYTRDVNVRWQYCSETVCGVKGPTCGGSIKRFRGLLASIDRNNNGFYDRYRDCLWVLKAPENKRIQVKVLSMDVEESEDCSADYLQIYEERFNHGKFCGNTKVSLLSLSSRLYVRWFSAGGDIGRGFNLTYFHTDDGIDAGGRQGGSAVVLDRQSRQSIINTTTPSTLMSGATGNLTSSTMPVTSSSVVFNSTIFVEPTSRNGLTTSTINTTLRRNNTFVQESGPIEKHDDNGLATTEVTNASEMINMWSYVVLLVFALVTLP